MPPRIITSPAASGPPGIDHGPRRGGRGVLACFYAAQFGHLGIVLPFLSPWLLAREFTAAEIGALLAVPALFKMTAPWTWGYWADRSGRRRGLLVVAAVVAGSALGALELTRGHWAIWGLLAIYGFARSPLLPYAEATVLEQSEARGFAYGPVRLWGSLAFAASSWGYGALAADPAVGSGLVGAAALLLAAAACATAFPPPRPGEEQSPACAGAAPASEGDGTGRFFAACALMQISHGAYYTFYSIHLQDLGFSGGTIGALWAFAVLCEVMMLGVVDRAVDGLGNARLLRICLAVAAGRWLLIAAVGSLAWLVVGQALHAFTYAAFHVAAIRVVHRRYAGARARGQALYSGMTYGLGMFVGSLAAGTLADPLGLPGLFVLSAAVALAALAVLGRSPA